MQNLNIEQIWDDFMEIFPFTDKSLDTTINCCKKDNIDPAKFTNNLFFLTGRKISDLQEISEPTKSINILLNYIPPGYSLFFVAAYPDVVVWFMDNYDTDSYQDNVYFNEIKTKSEKYIDSDNIVNWKFNSMIRIAYRKTDNFSKFECSF